MSRVKGKRYYDKNTLRSHVLEYIEELQADGLSEQEINDKISAFFTNTAIIKYTREQQDKMWDELYHLIMEVPGGYWQVVENMDYLPEFEHGRFKSLRSVNGEK